MSDALRLCFIDINANSKAIFSLNNYITKQNLKDGGKLYSNENKGIERRCQPETLLKKGNTVEIDMTLW